MAKQSALTFEQADALLRFDPTTGFIHWRKKPRGRQRPDMRAGSERWLRGKSLGRVVTIRGQRHPETHVAHLLQHGIWPGSRRRPKAAAPEVEPSLTTVPALEARAPAVPPTRAPLGHAPRRSWRSWLGFAC